LKYKLIYTLKRLKYTSATQYNITIMEARASIKESFI